MPSLIDDSSEDVHFCLLVHGLWGNPKHLNYVSSALRSTYPSDSLHIYLAKTNAGNFTYDGIELGGERITYEVEEELSRLEQDGKRVKKISIVGYSLGGLIARYAVGIMYSKGLFDKYEPTNFTTFATPHLGARSPLAGFATQLFNTLGANTLSESGRQLFITDSFRDSGRPLLELLADPNSIFMTGLAAFKNKSLYANAVNDRSVPYYTSYVTSYDPFADLSAIQIDYVPDTEDVIISDIATAKHDQQSFIESVTTKGRALIKTLPFALFLTLAIPIGTTVYICNAAVQSFQSASRIKLHESGKAGIGIDSYRFPLMIEARKRVSDFRKSINTEREQEHQQKHAGSNSDPQNAAIKFPEGRSGGITAEAQALMLSSGKKSDSQRLNLTPGQFRMIEALDNVGFRKYAVHIHHVRHSHAAIIMRTPRDSLREGKVVVGHWVERFEL